MFFSEENMSKNPEMSQTLKRVFARREIEIELSFPVQHWEAGWNSDGFSCFRGEKTNIHPCNKLELRQISLQSVTCDDSRDN